MGGGGGGGEGLSLLLTFKVISLLISKSIYPHKVQARSLWYTHVCLGQLIGSVLAVGESKDCHTEPLKPPLRLKPVL